MSSSSALYAVSVMEENESSYSRALCRDSNVSSGCVSDGGDGGGGAALACGLMLLPVRPVTFGRAVARSLALAAREQRACARAIIVGGVDARCATGVVTPHRRQLRPINHLNVSICHT